MPTYVLRKHATILTVGSQGIIWVTTKISLSSVQTGVHLVTWNKSSSVRVVVEVTVVGGLLSHLVASKFKFHNSNECICRLIKTD